MSIRQLSLGRVDLLQFQFETGFWGVGKERKYWKIKSTVYLCREGTRFYLMPKILQHDKSTCAR